MRKYVLVTSDEHIITSLYIMHDDLVKNKKNGNGYIFIFFNEQKI